MKIYSNIDIKNIPTIFIAIESHMTSSLFCVIKVDSNIRITRLSTFFELLRLKNSESLKSDFLIFNIFLKHF